jgi:hypothetical protein
MDIKSEHIDEFRRVENAAASRPLLDRESALACSYDEIFRIDHSQSEQQFRLCIEASADPVESRGHVLAHRCGIRATAAERDLVGRGEQADAGTCNALHDGGGRPPLNTAMSSILAPTRISTAVPSGRQ